MAKMAQEEMAMDRSIPDAHVIAEVERARREREERRPRLEIQLPIPNLPERPQAPRPGATVVTWRIG